MTSSSNAYSYSHAHSGTPPLVFISYAHGQHTEAEAISRVVREVGMVPWMATEAIAPGDSVVETIHEAIERSSFIVVIIQAEPPSAWQEREWQTALSGVWNDSRKRLLPVLLPGAKLPPFLATHQAFKLDPDMARWDSSLDLLAHALLADTTQEQPAAKERGAGRLQGRRRLDALERDAAAL